MKEQPWGGHNGTLSIRILGGKRKPTPEETQAAHSVQMQTMLSIDTGFLNVCPVFPGFLLDPGNSIPQPQRNVRILQPTT